MRIQRKIRLSRKYNSFVSSSRSRFVRKKAAVAVGLTLVILGVCICVVHVESDCEFCCAAQHWTGGGKTRRVAWVSQKPIGKKIQGL